LGYSREGRSALPPDRATATDDDDDDGDGGAAAEDDEDDEDEGENKDGNERGRASTGGDEKTWLASRRSCDLNLRASRLVMPTDGDVRRTALLAVALPSPPLIGGSAVEASEGVAGVPTAAAEGGGPKSVLAPSEETAAGEAPAAAEMRSSTVAGAASAKWAATEATSLRTPAHARAAARGSA